MDNGDDYEGTRVFLQYYSRPVYRAGGDGLQLPPAPFAADDFSQFDTFEPSTTPVQTYRIATPSSQRQFAHSATFDLSDSSVCASTEESLLFDYSNSASSDSSVATGPPQWFQQLQHSAPQPVLPTGPHLWCEFNPLLGCRQTFALTDKESWIRHHLHQHLEEGPPSQVMCWFCDNVSFPNPQSQVDRRDNFRSRMNHIYEHIRYDGRTFAEIRPDFFIIKHLVRANYLTNEQADVLLSYDERPARLRLPEPFPETRSTMPSSASYNQGVFYDIAKEERHRRRAKGKGSSARHAIHGFRV